MSRQHRRPRDQRDRLPRGQLELDVSPHGRPRLRRATFLAVVASHPSRDVPGQREPGGRHGLEVSGAHRTGAGHHRHEPQVDGVVHPLDQFGAGPGSAPGEAVRADDQGQSRHPARQRLTQAGAVRTQHIDLEPELFLGFQPPVLERPERLVPAVGPHPGVRLQDLQPRLPGAPHLAAGDGIQCDLHAFGLQGRGQVTPGQGGAVEDQPERSVPGPGPFLGVLMPVHGFRHPGFPGVPGGISGTRCP